MSTSIHVALTDNPPDARQVEILAADLVALVDSIPAAATGTDAGRGHLVSARLSAAALRGDPGRCETSAGLLRTLLNFAAPSAVKTTAPRPKPVETPAAPNG